MQAPPPVPEPSPEGVRAFSAQPSWLLRPSGGRVRRHAPDIFVRLADGRGAVVDVRADDRIEPEDAEAFRATAVARESVGWDFRRAGLSVGGAVHTVTGLSGSAARLADVIGAESSIALDSISNNVT